MRTLLLIALVLLLLAIAWLAVDLSEQAVDHDTVRVKTVQQWGTERPPFVVDSAMFTTTTTATIPRARTAPMKPHTEMRAASAGPAVLEDNVRGYPCGGTLPPCYVLRRESMMATDPPRVWNGNCYMPVGSYGQCGRSTASGLWQILRSTWKGYDGYVNAADAPVSVQNDFARMLWASPGGHRHWGAA